MVPSYKTFLLESAEPVEIVGEVPASVVTRLASELRKVSKIAKLQLGVIRVEVVNKTYTYQASARTSRNNLVAVRADADMRFVAKYGWIDHGGRLFNAGYSPEVVGKWEKSGAVMPTDQEVKEFHRKMVDVYKVVFGDSSPEYYQQNDLQNGDFDPTKFRFICGVRTFQTLVVLDLTKGVARVMLGYSPNGGGYNGPSTQYETRDVRIQKSLPGAEKVLSLKLWAELAKPVLAKSERASKAFSDYLRSKYPNGIPDWPHTPD